MLLNAGQQVAFVLARNATAAAASDLAHLLVRWFRFLGGRLGDRAFFLVALVVVALLAALALRLVLVAVLVAMFVFPCFEIANVGHTVTSEGKPHPADSWQILRTFGRALLVLAVG